MNWGYIAGYLDADGTVICNMRNHQYILSWTSIDKLSLVKMKDFMEANGIPSKLYEGNRRTKAGNTPWVLMVSRRIHIVDLGYLLLPHIVLKKDKLIKLINRCNKSMYTRFLNRWKNSQGEKFMNKRLKRTGLTLEKCYELACKGELRL